MSRCMACDNRMTSTELTKKRYSLEGDNIIERYEDLCDRCLVLSFPPEADDTPYEAIGGTLNTEEIQDGIDDLLDI